MLGDHARLEGDRRTTYLTLSICGQYRPRRKVEFKAEEPSLRSERRSEAAREGVLALLPTRIEARRKASRLSGELCFQLPVIFCCHAVALSG